jgi:DNA-binding FadR family transcriptional regulator
MIMNTSLTTTTLADQAEKKIIEYIKENELGPGATLPNEMQFSEMMGISRSVVREAMSRLRMLGIIQSRTKRGMVITEPPLLNGFKKVLVPNLLSTDTLKEIMGMRISLEIGLAEFLFANIQEKDLDELDQIVTRQQGIGLNNLTIEDEMQFHSKIYEIAGNDFILQLDTIMHPIFVFAKQTYKNYFLLINKQLMETGEQVNHPDLLCFMKSGDKAGYQGAMKKHLIPYWEFIYNFDLQ